MITTILIVLAVTILYIIPVIVSYGYWTGSTNIACDWYWKECLLSLVPLFNIYSMVKIFIEMYKYSR